MFKVFAVLSFIIAGFMGFLLLKGYANDLYVWIAFATSIFNGILYASISSLQENSENQRNDIKWLEGELSKVKSQLADIKKKSN